MIVFLGPKNVKNGQIIIGLQITWNPTILLMLLGTVRNWQWPTWWQMLQSKGNAATRKGILPGCDELVKPKTQCGIILSIRDMVVECWNRQLGCENIYPTQKLISMNLLQMIKWAWSFLTSEVVAKDIISRCTLWHFNSTFESSLSASSAYQRFTKKWDQLWLSASIQPPYLEF